MSTDVCIWQLQTFSYSLTAATYGSTMQIASIDVRFLSFHTLSQPLHENLAEEWCWGMEPTAQKPAPIIHSNPSYPLIIHLGQNSLIELLKWMMHAEN